MKKTLLIAAAALVAGIVSTQAQVYSANVVGYVNVVIPGNGAYSLISNPLDDGNGNQSSNLFSAFGNGTSITTYTAGNFDAPIPFQSGAWVGSKPLPPGIGFFIKNGKAGSPTITNTFVGTVVAPAGGSVTNVLGLGYTLAGSITPYAGDLTTDPNLNLASPFSVNGNSITTWQPGASGYDAPVPYQAGAWTSGKIVTVAQGYFLYSKHFGTNWVQTLP